MKFPWKALEYIFSLCNFERGQILFQVERIRRFRKNVTLTDLQIKKLYELGDFDGIDAMQHASKAIDEYLERNHLKVKTPKKSNTTARFKDCSPDSRIAGAFWVSGSVGTYQFSALILPAPAKTAIDRGKVSKLSIWDPQLLKKTNSFINACVVNYDRGWDIRPSKLAEPLYLSVKDLIHTSSFPLALKN